MAGLRLLAAATTVSALALLTGPAQSATSGATMTDPAGDIPVPSLDVLSGLIRLDTVPGARTLTMSATMRAPLTGVPGDYDLGTAVRSGSTCSWLAARVRWNGAVVQQAYMLQDSAPCESGEVPFSTLTRLAVAMAQYAVTGQPITGSVTGSQVTVRVPAPAWLRPGAVASFTVLTHPAPLGFSDYVNGVEVRNYDLAYGDKGWRVG